MENFSVIVLSFISLLTIFAVFGFWVAVIISVISKLYELIQGGIPTLLKVLKIKTPPD